MNGLIRQNISVRGLYACGDKFRLDLSLSENPLGCSDGALGVIKCLSKKDLYNYPDMNSSDLVDLISNKYGIKKEMVLVANGSESIIQLLPKLFLTESNEVIIPELTFPLFSLASKMVGAKVIGSKMNNNFDIDLKDMGNRIINKTKLIFLCNPNNPTGRVLGKKEIVEFVSQVGIPVIVDEANIEFGGESVIDKVNGMKNLIVIRTFSKAYGLAGFRIGFCVANIQIINNLKKISQLFGVNRLAMKAAIAALSDNKFISESKKLVNKEIKFITNELRERRFLVIDSRANNLFIKASPIFRSGDELVDKLNQRGVSVVRGKSFGRKWKDFIRISPRKREVNLEFIKIIDDLIRNN